jgi:23S rRNA pseudouridine955/2504/2580 synthase
MGAARKTGKRGDAAPAGGGAAPGVAPDRASTLTVGPEGEGQRLDNYLLRIAKGVPKSHVYRIVRSGEVRVNKGRAAADLRLAIGDVVRVPPLRIDRAAARLRTCHMPPVLYEDEHLIAVTSRPDCSHGAVVLRTG